MGNTTNINRDVINDSKSDVRGINDYKNSDYGGDLLNRDGVDLNSGFNISSEVQKNSDQNDVGEDLNDSGLDVILENFHEDNWNDLSLSEQKQSMTDLADFVTIDIGLKNHPEIVFRDDMPDGSYGSYNPDTNIMEINQNMLDDSIEAADTIAHELWHAHQQEASNDSSNPRASEYQEGFNNYISPEYDFEGYENQMIESEARNYAQGFKDRLIGAA